MSHDFLAISEFGLQISDLAALRRKANTPGEKRQRGELQFKVQSSRFKVA
jgi:hypothetical protein